MGLYFVIRSGNFMLKNSCIKQIVPIFFAYSRDKYEELTLKDYLTLPQELLDDLMDGKWTVSLTHTMFYENMHRHKLNHN